jgi:hypothetical protein
MAGSSPLQFRPRHRGTRVRDVVVPEVNVGLVKDLGIEEGDLTIRTRSRGCGVTVRATLCGSKAGRRSVSASVAKILP